MHRNNEVWLHYCVICSHTYLNNPSIPVSIWLVLSMSKLYSKSWTLFVTQKFSAIKPLIWAIVHDLESDVFPKTVTFPSLNRDLTMISTMIVLSLFSFLLPWMSQSTAPNNVQKSFQNRQSIAVWPKKDENGCGRERERLARRVWSESARKV